MRRVTVVFALLLFACATTEADKPNSDGEKDKAPAKAEPEVEPDADKPPPGVKVHGNLPIKTESELAAEAEGRSKCVADCVEARKMEAKGAEAIESECNDKCLQQHP